MFGRGVVVQIKTVVVAVGGVDSSRGELCWWLFIRSAAIFEENVAELLDLGRL